MLFWALIAILIIVPLIVHLRGGTVVALSLSVAVIYGIGVLTALLVTLAPTVGGPILGLISQISGAPETAYHDTYYITGQLKSALLPMLMFAAIAALFWLLSKWRAPLSHDPLKTLFWFLHVSLLALPVAMAFFLSAGMPQQYVDGSDGFSVFIYATGIVNLLILIALIGLAYQALKSSLKRLRGTP